MAREDLLENPLALLGLELMLDHGVQQPVHDSEERGDLLIRELVLHAEFVVHHVEVQNQLINLVDLVFNGSADALQSENGVEHSSLLVVRLRLPQVLGLVLIQRRVEEEVRRLVVAAQVRRHDGGLALVVV